MTGRHLFLMYAFPCASDKLANRKISLEQFLELKQLVENVGQPDLELLSVCFPDAV